MITPTIDIHTGDLIANNELLAIAKGGGLGEFWVIAGPNRDDAIALVCIEETTGSIEPFSTCGNDVEENEL